MGLRKRVKTFVTKGGTLQTTPEEEKLLKKFYQVTFRDNPDWSCPRCVGRCMDKIWKWLEQHRPINRTPNL